MTERKQLGMFWGNNALYCVETHGANPKKIFHIPFGDQARKTLKNGPMSPGGMELISDIQNSLHKQKIGPCAVNLSLPTRDVIFRSFVIPWMQQHETKSAVEFEVSKYIPFPLDELSYAFHPITVTENDIKRIRVIFVAIKKDTLENYLAILKEASLRVAAAEPAASSLIRTFSFKNLIPENQTVALIEKEDVGRIIVIDHEVPQFVREFHLSIASNAKAPEDTTDAIVKKLTKEVRISLDYFNRQNEQLHVRKILLLTSSHSQELPKSLEKNLEMPVLAIDDQSILSNAPQPEIGFLNAYGASVIPPTGSPLCFDLLRQKSLSKEALEPVLKTPIDSRSLILLALVCIPVIIISVIASGFLTQNLKKEIHTLKQELGPSGDEDILMVEQKEALLSTRLTHFKKIRTRSNAASFLLMIPDLLPEGTWVRNLDIAYDDSAVLAQAGAASPDPTTPASTAEPEPEPSLVVTIDGYAYSENKSDQFRLANMLVKNLKDDEKFSGFFRNIELGQTNAQKLDEYQVTAFKIVCRQSHGSQRPE